MNNILVNRSFTQKLKKTESHRPHWKISCSWDVIQNYNASHKTWIQYRPETILIIKFEYSFRKIGQWQIIYCCKVSKLVSLLSLKRVIWQEFNKINVMSIFKIKKPFYHIFMAFLVLNLLVIVWCTIHWPLFYHLLLSFKQYLFLPLHSTTNYTLK